MHLRKGKTQQQAVGRFLKQAAVGLWLHAQDTGKPQAPGAFPVAKDSRQVRQTQEAVMPAGCLGHRPGN